MSAPFRFGDDCDAIGATQRVRPTGKEQRGDIDMQRLTRLVVAVDLGVYRVTEQGPAVTVIVFDVMTGIVRFGSSLRRPGKRGRTALIAKNLNGSGHMARVRSRCPRWRGSGPRGGDLRRASTTRAFTA